MKEVSGYSLEVITPHGKLHSRKLEKNNNCTDVRFVHIKGTLHVK